MQDAELVNQLKERLPEALFEKLNGSLSIDRDRLRFAEYKGPGIGRETATGTDREVRAPGARNSPTHNWNCSGSLVSRNSS